MPKVKLGRNPTLERQEATRKVIRRAMAERRIKSQRELAKKDGRDRFIVQPQVSDK